MRELKAQNDSFKSENESLRGQVRELHGQVTELTRLQRNLAAALAKLQQPATRERGLK